MWCKNDMAHALPVFFFQHLHRFTHASGTVIHTWKYMIMYIPVSCHVLFAPFVSLFIHFPYIHTKLW